MYSPTHHPTRAKNNTLGTLESGARVKRSFFSITTYFLAVFLMVIFYFFLHQRFPQFVIHYYYHNYYCICFRTQSSRVTFDGPYLTLSICVARVIVVQQSSACAFRVGFAPRIILYIYAIIIIMKEKKMGGRGGGGAKEEVKRWRWQRDKRRRWRRG